MNLFMRFLLFTCALVNLSCCFPIYSSARISPSIKVVESHKLSKKYISSRMSRREILIEKQTSKITSLKKGGSGYLIHSSSFHKISYHNQIKNLKLRNYVTTYYIYNPYTNDIDDAIWWYSFVTKSPSDTSVKVISSQHLTNSIQRKRVASHYLLFSKRFHTIYHKGFQQRVITFSLFNPNTSKKNDVIDQWTYKD